MSVNFRGTTGNGPTLKFVALQRLRQLSGVHLPRVWIGPTGRSWPWADHGHARL